MDQVTLGRVAIFFFFGLFFFRLQLFVRTISIQSSNSEEFGITCMCLDRGRKPEYLERSLHRSQGERANSTRKVTGSLCNYNIPSAVVPSL